MSTPTPVGDDDDAHTCHFDEQPPSLAQVRRWTAEVLPDLAGTEVLDDVLLVVNELVSNAYDHAARPTRLRLVRSGEPLDQLRIEVDDPSAERPTEGRSRIAATRGRGLALVAKLTRGWGFTPRRDGKTVWATITCG